MPAAVIRDLMSWKAVVSFLIRVIKVDRKNWFFYLVVNNGLAYPNSGEQVLDFRNTKGLQPAPRSAQGRRSS